MLNLSGLVPIGFSFKKIMSSLVDTQNETDDRNLPIDKVGVKALRYPLSIKDRDGHVQNTVATLALAVELPKEYKGTHMSRFVEALNEADTPLEVSSVVGLPNSLLERLPSHRAHVDLRFPFFRSKPAPVTKKAGMLDYEVQFEVEASRDGDTDLTVTVFVPVTTLCPCSKAISEYGAHNQRGQVTFAVKMSSPIWIEDLIELVETSASAELYSLLKREDEKFVTEQAYENPVFVEDLVRNVATKAHAHSKITWFRVEAENFESIHNHNAYAVIEA